MPKLTKKTIDAAKPTAKEYVLWDTELRGFGLRIKPSGVKTFLVQYRNENGRSRRMSLGHYGTLTAEEARLEARQALANATRGEDVATTKAAKRHGDKMADLAQRYLVDHAELKKKPSSLRNDRQMIRDYVKPVLGQLLVAAVTKQDIVKLHHDIRQKPTTANRLLALLSKMFNLAEKWGLRPDGSNPCRHVDKFRETKRERYLTTEELSRLGETLTKVETEGKELPSVITAIRLLIFTGARLSEILELRWEHVDFTIGSLRLPDSKTGAKIIPLGSVALEILKNTPRHAENPYVCPGYRRGSHLVNLSKPWGRIRDKAGIPDVRLHDLRHSFASVGAGAGLGLPVIGGLLGHKVPATTARYAHLAPHPLKEAADTISIKIDQAMKQKPIKGNVIPFKGKR